MDKFVCQLSTVLVLIGALNWGVMGVHPGWNVVKNTTTTLVKNPKTSETVERTVYILVGLAALFLIWKKLSK